MDRTEFARYMRSAREKTGLSKFAAGKALGYISDGTINAIEQGRMPLPVEQIHPISRLYGIQIDELLDKLKECEPHLYRRYLKLQEDIITHFAKRVAGQRSSIVSAGQARHHRQVDIRYILSEVIFKPMEQMRMDLRERKMHETRQKVLLFPHVRIHRTQSLHPARNLLRHELRPAA